MARKITLYLLAKTNDIMSLPNRAWPCIYERAVKINEFPETISASFVQEESDESADFARISLTHRICCINSNACAAAAVHKMLADVIHSV